MAQNSLRNNRIFGILLLLTQLVLAFMFGFFITYTSTVQGISDDYFIISALLILALAGFGLIATYVKPVSVATITQLLIILGLSIQLYFPFRGFWEIIGLSGSKYANSGDDILPISITNIYNDRQQSQTISSSPLTDFIACFISLVVGYSAVLGRLGNLELYFFTVIGTFIYEFNSMIFWRIFVTDCGYGMRIFLYGGLLGLFASIIIGKKETTVQHLRYVSEYYHQALSLVGAVLVWCLLPVLNWSDLFHAVGTDPYILHPVSLNMWLALCGSVFGSVIICILLYKKLSARTLVFSLFTGGIAYSSISDIYLNPGVAIAIGTLSSFITSYFASVLKGKWNQNGIRDTNGVIGSYLVPGLIAGVLSAIFQANGAQWGTSYTANFDQTRTRFQQGGVQIAGLFIAIGLGIFAGIVSGLLMRIFNRDRTGADQFDGNFVVNGQAIVVNDEDN